MTVKADYTAEEWELITRAPIMVAMAVVLACPSGPVGVVAAGDRSRPNRARTPMMRLDSGAEH